MSRMLILMFFAIATIAAAVRSIVWYRKTKHGTDLVEVMNVAFHQGGDLGYRISKLIGKRVYIELSNPPGQPADDTSQQWVGVIAHVSIDTEGRIHSVWGEPLGISYEDKVKGEVYLHLSEDRMLAYFPKVQKAVFRNFSDHHLVRVTVY